MNGLTTGCVTCNDGPPVRYMNTSPPSDCVTSCGAARYGRDSDNSCQNCYIGCSACSGTDINCSACKSGYYLYGTTCYTLCPLDSLYENSLTNTCGTCNGKLKFSPNYPLRARPCLLALPKPLMLASIRQQRSSRKTITNVCVNVFTKCAMEREP